jgi:hypothetical protein
VRVCVKKREVRIRSRFAVRGVVRRAFFGDLFVVLQEVPDGEDLALQPGLLVVVDATGVRLGGDRSRLRLAVLLLQPRGARRAAVAVVLHTSIRPTQARAAESLIDHVVLAVDTGASAGAGPSPPPPPRRRR